MLGTHVSGSVAGFSIFNYGDFKKYNGNAYNAKIAFFDIGKTGSTSLATPGDINRDLLQKLYQTGARIITNSWGTTRDNTYNKLSKQVDDFMWTYPGN